MAHSIYSKLLSGIGWKKHIHKIEYCAAMKNNVLIYINVISR